MSRKSLPKERRKGWLEKSISFKRQQYTAIDKIAKKNQESFPDVVRRASDKLIEEEGV
jgi:hypothetical protein